MVNLATILWYFYKPLLKFNLIFTLWALYAFWVDGMPVIGVTLLIKTIGYITGTGYQYFMASNSYYYYRNAGFQVRKLYVLAYVFDFCSYLILLTAYILINHVHLKG